MTDFSKPFKINKEDFYCSIGKIIPEWSDIPEYFRNRHYKYNPVDDDVLSKWFRLQSDWFYFGIKNLKMIPKNGIEKSQIIDYLALVNQIVNVEQEHKVAAFAYLCSIWIEAATWQKLG
jgi:hypothetical protein